MTITKKTILFIGLTIMGCTTQINAQDNTSSRPSSPQVMNSEIKLYEPDELKTNQKDLLSHRIELREIGFENGKQTLESYTYVTVDHVKQLGEKMLLINWMPLTKFGTGLDICFVSSEDLSLRYRLTPKGLPFGLLLESHAFDYEANVAEVNVDAKHHAEEIKTVYPSVKQLHQKPSTALKHRGHFNAISIPYLLASMDLKQDFEFIVPGFSPYSNKEYYHRLKVLGQVTYTDLKGKKYQAFEVEAISKPSLEEARATISNTPGRRSTYYVSNEAPYFFGKIWYSLDENANRTEIKHWTLNDWQLNQVDPNMKRDELIAEWEKIKKAEGIKVPWGKKN